MKKCLVLFGLFVLLAPEAWAGNYALISVSSNPGGTDCSVSSPCMSFANAAATITERPFTIEYLIGHYTTTGNPAAFIDIGETTFPRWDGANWGTIKGSIVGTGLYSSTEAVILSSYTVPVNVYHSSYIVIQDLYIENGVDGGVSLTDSNHLKVKRVGIKNPHRWTANFGVGVGMNSANNGGDNNRGLTDSLLEDVWVVGLIKYGIMLGGTTTFAERNVVRRAVVRWDGSSPCGNDICDSGNPTGGIVNYGATTGINGALNNTIQNSIVLDNNPCVAPYYEGGDTCYGAFYNPHSAKDIAGFGNIALNNQTGWRGFMFGEDSASGIQQYNGISWENKGSPLFSSVNATSGTFRNGTIYSSTPTPFFNAGSHSIQNTLWYRSASPVEGSSSTHNGYFPSTSAPAGGQVRYMDDPYASATIYITSPSVVMSTRGWNGYHGARVMYKYGQDNTLYGETGWNVLSSTPLFNPDFPYGARIKSLFAAPDTGSAKANNPTNDTTRGWTATDLDLATYIVTYATTSKTCPSDICIGAAAQGGGEGSTPSPTVNGFRGSFRMTGNLIYGKP